MTSPHTPPTEEIPARVSNRKSRLKLVFRVGFLCLFVALFVWFFITHRSEFAILAKIPPILLVLIALFQLGVILTNVVFQILLLKIYDIKMPWLESFVVIVKSSVINFFGFFQGGAGYRAYYLKKRYGVEYRKFALLFTANYLMIFSVSAFFGFVGSLIQLLSNEHFTNLGTTIFFAASTVFLVTLMFVNPTKLPRGNRLFRRVVEVLSGWELIVKDKKLLLSLFIVSLAQFWILAGAFFFELKAVHANASLAGLMVYSAIAGFSILVALTPAAIGFRETLLIFARQSLGVSVSIIVLSATVDRIVYFFLLLALSVLTQEHVMRTITKRFLKES
jgi:uncharacterized membrane protein YbhN (UPF0104 family)